MSKKRELSLDFINDLEKSYEERKEVEISIKTPKGLEKAIVYVDKYFSPKKIDMCVKELIQKADFLKTIIPKNKDIKDIMQLWLVLLIIRNFSSLDIPYEFKKQVAVLEKLTDAKILLQIYEEFDTQEILKVMNELDRVTLILQKRVNENEDNFKAVNKNLTSLKDLNEIKE